jgi:hypothetical protein
MDYRLEVAQISVGHDMDAADAHRFRVVRGGTVLGYLR